MNHIRKTIAIMLACASLAGGFASAEITNPKDNKPTISRPSFSTSAPEIQQDAQLLHIHVDGIEAQQSVTLQPGDHTISWAADQDVLHYSFYIYNESGKLLKSAEEVKATGIKLSTKPVDQDIFYTLTVKAMLAGGQELSYTVHLACYAGNTAEPTIEPTVEPTPVPTEVPTQAPAAAPTLPNLVIATAQPAVTEAPKAVAGTPVIEIASEVYLQDGVYYIDSDSVSFYWSASGQVESYDLAMVDQENNRIDLGTTSNTGMRVARDQFQPGIWTLHIGARPVGGADNDMAWASISFGIDDALRPVQNSISNYTGTFDIDASSFRYSNNIPVYGSCAMDGDLSSAWNTEQRISGEYLDIAVTDGRSYQVAGVRIAPGYWKNSDVFKNNARPAVIDFYCDGAYAGSFELQDAKDYQTFWLDAPVTGSSFRLVIRDGYDGRKYSDCCITEVELLGPLGMHLKEVALADWGRAVQTAQRVVMNGQRIEKGDEGLHVVGLQLLLRDGFGILEGTVDGDFGSGTRSAVKELAERMEDALPDCERMSSGVVDDAFWRNMLAYMELL